NVKNIAYQAEVIGPAIERINETGGTVVGALPLLCDAAERIGVAKSAPYIDPSETPYSAPSSTPAAVTHEAAVTSETPYSAPSSTPAAVTHEAAVTPEAPRSTSPRGVGYLDGDGVRGSLGYLDA
ncbi:MAG: hypothetical protein ACRDRE_10000, partial [Pseudonocardiaceae bacterium]